MFPSLVPWAGLDQHHGCQMIEQSSSWSQTFVLCYCSSHTHRLGHYGIGHKINIKFANIFFSFLPNWLAWSPHHSWALATDTFSSPCWYSLVPSLFPTWHLLSSCCSELHCAHTQWNPFFYHSFYPDITHVIKFAWHSPTFSFSINGCGSLDCLYMYPYIWVSCFFQNLHSTLVVRHRVRHACSHNTVCKLLTKCLRIHR